MHTIWQTARFTLDLSAPKIMGIINITPDSFSDGGTYSQSVQAALKHAEQLLEDGALAANPRARMRIMCRPRRNGSACSRFWRSWRGGMCRLAWTRAAPA